MLVAGWILALTVAAPSPTVIGTTVLSFIPLFSPVIMPVRIAAGVAPFWQVAISVVLVIGTIALFVARRRDASTETRCCASVAG